MTPYRDWDQDSGIRAYEIGSTHMDVAFKDGAVYRYTALSAGRANLGRMVVLARAGDALNEFINRAVRNRYLEKLAQEIRHSIPPHGKQVDRSLPVPGHSAAIRYWSRNRRAGCLTRRRDARSPSPGLARP